MRQKIEQKLAQKGAVVLLGMYGMGKVKVVEKLIKERKNDEIIRINCKNLPVPAEDDIPLLCGYKNWVQLHNGWSRIIKKNKKGRKKTIVVIEGVEQLLENGEKLWEILWSLRYYEKNDFEMILSGTAKVVSFDQGILRRIIRGNVIWVETMKRGEVFDLISEYEKKLKYPLVGYQTAIMRMAHGHYGTVKYLCQLIEDNQYRGSKLTEVQVIKWAEKRGDLDYFVEKVWEGYSSQQQRVIALWIQMKKRESGLSEVVVREIIQSGLWYRGGRQLKWRVGWIEKKVREYIKSIGIMDSDIEKLVDSVLLYFGKKELRVVKELQGKKGKVVSYDVLGDVMVGEEGDYSRYAISQIVARIRRKLAIVAPRIIIETVRGEGYRWR